MLNLLLHGLSYGQQLVHKTDSIPVEASNVGKLRVTGYVQTQFQIGEPAASLKVGGPNTHPDQNFNRFGVRRGRVKVQYEKGIVLGVIQIDATEKGLGLKDAYLKVSIPSFGTSSVQAGVFNRPFGYEVAYSSSRRETPERAIINTTLFPDERDLGVMATFQANKTSSWHFLKLDVGLFAGNGIQPDTDSRKDLMSRLSFHKSFQSEGSLSGGLSYYYGGVYQGTQNVYSISDQSFVLNSKVSNLGEFAKREYVGIDVQWSFKSLLGQTKFQGEYIIGKQPGTEFSSKSPNSSSVSTSDTYLRTIRGGYLTWVQSIGKLPVSMVAKLDWYDPNTRIARNEIGLGGTGIADVLYQTLGFGILWDIQENLRLLAHGEFLMNERSENLPFFARDLKDNVLTVRLQFKF